MCVVTFHLSRKGLLRNRLRIENRVVGYVASGVDSACILTVASLVADDDVTAFYLFF